ncbi:hypothetical protein DFQ09_105200 [Winogradskyella pacifica]|uniref:Uncharacterized protein n=1 Tax=Winogradskyella pacifica TaxID=664642 RepID=A0A3D9MD94_9FLAO|nr:hypothetical protein DFQ09_105200 [Winogradskyella pacifica]
MIEYKVIVKHLAEDLQTEIDEAAADNWKIKTNPIVTDEGVMIIVYRT